MLRSNSIRIRKAVYLATASLMILFLATPATAAHPQHTSFAEVGWNPKTGNFEVALCVWALDLEHALGTELQDVNNWDDRELSEFTDAQFESYLASRFTIRAVPDTQTADQASGANKTNDSKMRWVGHETDGPRVWLYFEIKGFKSPASWELKNSIFFDRNDNQLNQVRISIDGATHDFSLTQSNPCVSF